MRIKSKKRSDVVKNRIISTEEQNLKAKLYELKRQLDARENQLKQKEEELNIREAQLNEKAKLIEFELKIASRMDENNEISMVVSPCAEKLKEKFTTATPNSSR